ncbi:MAG: PepSY domain-containing protein [Tannerella sp.]|nr:PepSY domain-containing protein [Tannerella sp.]
MRKAIKKIHLWMSIPFGLIISAVCLSGAALVFEVEILEFLYPERYFVEPVSGENSPLSGENSPFVKTPLPVNILIGNVVKTLPDTISVTSVSISADPRRAYRAGLSQPHRATICVNQFTGEVLPPNPRPGFFMIMFRMHRWLMDSMRQDGGLFVGKLLTGWSTLVFVLIILSGLTIWIPRRLKTLKTSLRISLNKGFRRFNYDFHLAAGFYAALLLLAMSLTGLTYSFPWYRTAFYRVFGVEASPYGARGGARAEGGDAAENGSRGGREGGGSRGGGGRGGRGGGGGRGGVASVTDFSNWQNVYGQLKTANPNFTQITVSNGTANVSFPHFGNRMASDQYTFDATSGELTGSTLYRNAEKSSKMRGWIMSVHFGTWGGMLTRILSFLAALAGGLLPLSGYCMWLKRTISRRRTRRKAALRTLPLRTANIP